MRNRNGTARLVIQLTGSTASVATAVKEMTHYVGQIASSEGLQVNWPEPVVLAPALVRPRKAKPAQKGE